MRTIKPNKKLRIFRYPFHDDSPIEKQPGHKKLTQQNRDKTKCRQELTPESLFNKKKLNHNAARIHPTPSLRGGNNKKRQI